MERLIVVGVVVLLSACAGQPYPSVPVEERGYGAPISRPAPSAPVSSDPTPSESVPASPATSSPSTVAPVIPEAAPTDRSYAAPNPATSVAPPTSRRYAGPPPALLALMEQADQYESQGNQQAALAQLERAQRIAPRDPMVYLQLARLRLHMNDRPRAEQLARRGLSLAGGDPDLESAFKALLQELAR